MKSVSGKNWEELKISNRLIEKAKIENNLNNIQAKLIVDRNFSKNELYVINNKLSLSNPFSKNKDFNSACLLLKKHISEKNKILIVGDYDVDGCVSTSLMVNFLKKFKLKINYYIPDRFKDGYGANKDLIIKLVLIYRPKLVIFLDCGSNSHSAINYLNSEKIDTMIIDHHNLYNPYPSSNILINPKKKNDYNGFDYLCTAFLTYLFIDLYQSQNHIKSSFKTNLIYVLLATISDVMPLRGINRLLAINVLKNFDVNENFIIKNIFKFSNINKRIQCDDLGYVIGPILNSAGRIDNANQVVKLLTSTSKKEILGIIEKLFYFNAKRKKIEARILNEIDLNSIDKNKGIICIYLPNISEGIIGIIASRIKEQFNKPCIVFTNSSNIIKGSARSTSNFNIADYIFKALKKEILISGGGHNLAAGITIFKNKINLFKNFLNTNYKNNSLAIDNFFLSKISLNSINKNFFDKVNDIGPFGNGNLHPTFLIENVKFIKPKILKKKFVSCFIKTNNKMIKAISFNQINSKVSYEILNSKGINNVLVKVKENIFNNNRFIQLEIIDIIKGTINT